jgi:hypothetical protein
MARSPKDHRRNVILVTRFLRFSSWATVARGLISSLRNQMALMEPMLRITLGKALGRTFKREHLPPQWTRSWRQLCPAVTPALECTTEDPRSTDLIWQALNQDPAMPRILRARENGAIRTVIIIQRWLDASEEILAKLEEVLGEESGTG